MNQSIRRAAGIAAPIVLAALLCTVPASAAEKNPVGPIGGLLNGIAPSTIEMLGNGVQSSHIAEFRPDAFGGQGSTGEQGSAIPGHYVVVLKDSVKHPAAVAADQIQPDDIGLVYRHALNGYSATLSTEKVRALRHDSRVRYVVQDRKVEAVAQTIPTGIKRVFALTNPGLDIDNQDDVRIAANVAVIDSGIAANSDLNLVGKTNCVPAGENPDTEYAFEECVDGQGTDGNDHGTHVAGTIGALDNSSGVIGVAPGVRLWAVRVLNNFGSGAFSWIIAGIDWVTQTKEDQNPENNIDVANVSIGCGSLPCEYGPLDEALTASAEAGVVYVVAAGNNAGDAKYSTFGTNPDVITVSALADYDGVGGEMSSPTCSDYGPDDTLASFSNYGEDVELAAPGVCILSTLAGGALFALSGTSMASPHVAGAAAVLASEDHPQNLEDVEAIREALINDGNLEWTDTSSDGEHEPLTDIGGIATEPPVVNSETEVTLRGRARPGGKATTYHFEYGTSTGYGTSVPIPDASIGSGSTYVKVSKPVKSLQGATTYHARIVASNGVKTSYGADQTFGTTPPTAKTEPASNVHGNDAELRAVVNPKGAPTKYYFEYGRTSAYGRKAPLPTGMAGSGTIGVNVGTAVGILNGNQTYHFRVVATNSAGTAYGSDKTFTTPASQWTAERIAKQPAGPLPGPNPYDNYLAGVSCPSVDSCVAVGNYMSYINQMNSQHWDGEKWTTNPMAIPENSHEIIVQAVSCASEQSCVAVGYYNTAAKDEGLPLIEHWDGTKWTAQKLVMPEGIHHPAINAAPLMDVSCSSPKACMAVGSYSKENHPNRPLVYSWDGDDWTFLPMTVPPESDYVFFASSVDCVSASWCMVVGGHSSQKRQWYNQVAEVWNGKVWKIVREDAPDPFNEATMLSDVSCPTTDHCAATTFNTDLWLDKKGVPPIERWDGEKWTREELPKPVGANYAAPSRIVCTSTSACTAVGASWFKEGSAPAAFAWNGSTWSLQTTSEPTQAEEGPIISSGGLEGLSCVSTTTCTAVGWDRTQAGEYRGVTSFYKNTGPTAVTGTAQSVRSTSAVLAGAVNPGGSKTTYQFEYGQTKAYGAKIPTPASEIGSGAEDVEVTTAPKSLKPGATYHFRVVATNGNGVTYGEDRRFTTKPAKPSFTRKFGKYGTSSGQLNEPLGLAIGPQDAIWVADTENNRIEKFNSAGELVFQSGSSGTSEGKFKEPYAVAIDSSGNAWVADTFNNRIQKFNPEGKFVKAFGWGVDDGTTKAFQTCETTCFAGIVGSGAGQFDHPYGLTFDAQGNLWVVDSWSDRVEKFNSKGEFVSQFNAGVGAHVDIAIDSTGAIWLVDYQNHVRKFSQAGQLLLTFGSEGSDEGEFDFPSGIGIDSGDAIWVADSNNDRIQAFNLKGEYLTQFGQSGTGDGDFDFPRDVAFDSKGDLWVADSENSRIQEWQFGPSAVTEAAANVRLSMATLRATVNPQGVATTYQFEYGETEAYGTKVPASAEGIGSGTDDISLGTTLRGLESETTYHFRVKASNAEGASYGADQTFTTGVRAPVFSTSFGKYGTSSGQLNEPLGLAIGPQDAIWVADTENNRIEKFNSAGELVFQSGSSGTSEGKFKEPYAVAIDSSGNAWVADTFNNRIQKFNPEGKFVKAFGWGVDDGTTKAFQTCETTCFAGIVGSGAGQFDHPYGLTFDAQGNLWVVDSWSDRVEKFNSKGEFVSQFNAGVGAHVDIAIDSTGAIWLVDYQNHVRKFSQAGQLLLTFGSEGSDEGEFDFPSGIGIDSGDAIWVADSNNDRIQAFNLKGEYLTQFGQSGTGDGDFDFPRDVAFDSKGDLWVADSENSRIQEWAYPGKPKASTESATGVTTTAATLHGTVDAEGLDTTYYFEYGTTTSYGSKVPVWSYAIGWEFGGVSVTQALSGLTPGTVYHYRLVARSEAGIAYGEDKTLTTLKLPTVTTQTASPVTATGATLKATVNPEGSATTYQLEYGTTTSYGSKIPLSPKSIGSGISNVSISEAISGLSQATTYHYRVVASNAAGTSYGADKTLTTLKLPKATTEAATVVKATEATLNGTVNPEGSSTIYVFEYGTTTSYGSSTELKFIGGSADVKVSATLTGLSQGITYHYRLVAVSAAGVTNGADKTLTIKPPTATTQTASPVTATGATLKATVNPEGSATTYQLEYGTTTSYGSKIPLSPKSIGSGISNVSISEAISGLSQATTYHYRVVASNAAGTSYGADKTLTTLKLPKATTEAATVVKATEATLNGTVNPEGSSTIYVFEYGTTTSYGSSTELKFIGGSADVKVSATLTGLAKNTTYHFRLFAVSAGGEVKGADLSFTTTP